MGAFNAASILDPLDYDFSSLAGKPENISGLADAKGRIPEPSRKQVQQYMQASARELQRLQREAREAADAVEAKAKAGAEPEGAGSEEAGTEARHPVIMLTDGIAAADMRIADAAHKRDAAILSKLTSGEISTEILLLLPHRVYSAFSEWLVGEVMNPEAVTGAGTPHLTMLKSPAAG